MMNDNTADLPASVREAIRKAYAAGRTGGLKEGIDIIGRFAESRTGEAIIMNGCVALSQQLLDAMGQPVDYPEYMKP